VPIQEIKKQIDFDLIQEEARWKIYSKSLELKKQNKPLEALEIMKAMDGVITEQLDGFA
jgi:hypothetical protein